MDIGICLYVYTSHILILENESEAFVIAFFWCKHFYGTVYFELLKPCSLVS